MRSRQPSQQTELTSPGALAAPPGVPTPWHPVQLGASREDLLAALARSDSRILSFESVPSDRPKIVTSNDTMSLDFRSVCDRTDRNPVRTGSAAEWQTADNGGLERSPNVRQTRRSLRLQPPDLGWRGQAAWSSSLPPGCRKPFGLTPTRRWSPRTGLALWPSWSHRRQVGALSFSPPCHPRAQAAVTSGLPRIVTVIEDGRAEHTALTSGGGGG